jgi:hypothetical protein
MVSIDMNRFIHGLKYMTFIKISQLFNPVIVSARGTCGDLPQSKFNRFVHTIAIPDLSPFSKPAWAGSFKA